MVYVRLVVGPRNSVLAPTMPWTVEFSSLSVSCQHSSVEALFAADIAVILSPVEAARTPVEQKLASRKIAMQLAILHFRIVRIEPVMVGIIVRFVFLVQSREQEVEVVIRWEVGVLPIPMQVGSKEPTEFPPRPTAIIVGAMTVAQGML